MAGEEIELGPKPFPTEGPAFAPKSKLLRFARLLGADAPLKIGPLPIVPPAPMGLMPPTVPVCGRVELRKPSVRRPPKGLAS